MCGIAEYLVYQHIYLPPKIGDVKYKSPGRMCVGNTGHECGMDSYILFRIDFGIQGINLIPADDRMGW
ncbi:MAG: hypothetical protein APR55_02765 [Methanolinea sp. SDB]|nr:MAG: hypothetical protein APR55_02765 [Methanolinea sp. SDB]